MAMSSDPAAEPVMMDSMPMCSMVNEANSMPMCSMVNEAKDGALLLDTQETVTEPSSPTIEPPRAREDLVPAPLDMTMCAAPMMNEAEDDHLRSFENGSESSLGMVIKPMENMGRDAEPVSKVEDPLVMEATPMGNVGEDSQMLETMLIPMPMDHH